MTGDEIWDEHEWEAFLREHDRRLDRYMDLLFTFMGDHPPPPLDDASARGHWEQELRDFLRANGFSDEGSHVPFFGADPEEERPGEAFEEEPPEEADNLVYGLDAFPLYRQAIELATDVLDWSHALPGSLKDSTLVQLCSHLMQIPADLARGHAMGCERDMIGGNIAYVKRALAGANAALDLLVEAKRAAYMEPAVYARYYEAAYEVRNALGVYVQELRARFDLGVD